MRIGVTGTKGFLGSSIKRFFLTKNSVEILEINRNDWENEEKLDNFVKSVDVIVHTSGVNRLNDKDNTYSINIELTKKLIKHLEKNDSNPILIYTSSIQETNGSDYGNSKLESRYLLEDYCKRKKIYFFSLLIPNLFGPFCKPNYNSFIATFCYNVINNHRLEVFKNSEVSLVYVYDCVERIYDIILNKDKYESMVRFEDLSNKSSIETIKNKIVNFKVTYFEKGQIVSFKDDFELKLFITFQSYIDFSKHFPFGLKNNIDYRGNFVELFRNVDGGQFSFSNTKKQIKRGEHFHTRKIERFFVVRGKAEIEFREVLSNNKYTFLLDGDTPSFVDMPPWYTHSIKNIGDEDLVTIFYISEAYEQKDPDTFFYKV